jgi:hypothetical protein
MTREMPSSLTKLAHEFTYNRGVETRAKRDKERARDGLKAYLLESDPESEEFRIDENGHRYLDLENPIPDGDDLVLSIRAQRNVSSSIDLDKAGDILRAKGPAVYDRVFRRVVRREFDENELYAVNQAGLVTDDELDSMIIENVTYSLGTVKS